MFTNIQVLGNFLSVMQQLNVIEPKTAQVVANIFTVLGLLGEQCVLLATRKS